MKPIFEGKHVLVFDRDGWEFVERKSAREAVAVIAITDQWLPEPARKALYALSIFPPKPHTFTEEAALAVTASTTNELDILCDVGLLECNGEYYTMHQVISDYAHIHLDEA